MLVSSECGGRVQVDFIEEVGELLAGATERRDQLNGDLQLEAVRACGHFVRSSCHS